MKILMNFLKDISKRVQFYKAAAVQPTYLPKKRTTSEKNFNNYAKILITPILYKRNNSRGVFRTQSNILSFLTKNINGLKPLTMWNDFH